MDFKNPLHGWKTARDIQEEVDKVKEKQAEQIHKDSWRISCKSLAKK